MIDIHANIANKNHISARIGKSHGFNVDFGKTIVGTGMLPYYEGDYTVTPAVIAQALPTKGKSMKQDFIVEEIPNYIVSNEFGNTFIVG